MGKPLSILTPRLRLVPFARRHLTADYIGWLNDRERMRFSEQRDRVHTQEKCEKYFHSFEGTPNRFVAIEQRAEPKRFIGTATVYVDTPIANIGILIGDPTTRGQGLATEAWIGLMQFSFMFLDISKIEAGTLPANMPMLGVFAKAGMKPDNRVSSPVFWNDQSVNLVHVAAYRNAWTAPIPIEVESNDCQ